MIYVLSVYWCLTTGEKCEWKEMFRFKGLEQCQKVGGNIVKFHDPKVADISDYRCEAK